MPKVADPRHGRPLAEDGGAMASAGDHRAIVSNTEPRAYAGLLIDVLRFARDDARLLNDFAHEVRHDDGKFSAQVDRRFLLHDLDAEVALDRVMRVNRRADAVLELRDH